MQNTVAPIIQVQNVRRSYRSPLKKEGLRGSLEFLVRPNYQNHEALKGVSFNIHSGEFVGLIGANGAGKTTLLKILSGLIPQTTGNVSVLGQTPFDRKLEFRKSIALVMGQKAQLWWDLPAMDAFDLLRAIYEIPQKTYKERVDFLTHLLDVKKHLNTQIRRLSLGERMKMELIGALLHWPKVIYLDEPTIGLDVFAAHKLRQFLKEFNKTEGATIILTSHNMEDIGQLCPRILLIQSGSLIYDGSPSKLKSQDTQNPEEIFKRLRVHFNEEPSLNDLASKLEIPLERLSSEKQNAEESELTTYYINIRASEQVKSLQKLTQEFQITDIGFEEETLEQTIHRIFEKESK